jgi:hypothetical protein
MERVFTSTTQMQVEAVVVVKVLLYNNYILTNEYQTLSKLRGRFFCSFESCGPLPKKRYNSI